MDDLFPLRTDPVIGANDPMYPNSWDRVHIAIQAALEVEHNSDGVHNTYGGCRMLTGSFTGNGNATQVIATAGVDVKVVIIFDGNAMTVPALASAAMTMPNAKLLNNTVFSASYISALADGSFTVASSANVSGRTYYYLAAGNNMQNPTSDGDTTAPPWIQHGEAIEVGGSGRDIPGAVSAHILGMFRVGHADDGEHISAAYADFWKVVAGTYNSTGLTQVVPLNLQQIEALLVFANLAEYPIMATRSMTAGTSKELRNAAMISDGIVSISTPGQFTIGTNAGTNKTQPRFIALGFGTNSLAYSEDGISWTGIGATIFTGQGNGAAWNGTRFVACGSGANALAYSSDGISWTGIGTAVFTGANGVAWDGTRFVAVGGGGTNSIAYSSDGITWTGLGTGIFASAGYGVAWNGTRFVAVGAGTNTIAYSSDGINWTGIGATIFSSAGRGVAWNGTRFVAVGQGTNTIAYSTDGITWTGAGTSIFSTSGRGVAWNGTRFVAVGQGTNSIAYSTDGISWTGAGTSIFSTAGYGVAWNGTRVVACGQGTNTLAYSSDGISWTGSGTSIFSSSCYGVASAPAPAMTPAIPNGPGAYPFYYIAFGE